LHAGDSGASAAGWPQARPERLSALLVSVLGSPGFHGADRALAAWREARHVLLQALASDAMPPGGTLAQCAS